MATDGLRLRARLLAILCLLFAALCACRDAAEFGGDALASAVVSDDVCAPGANPEACEVSLRQLRGEARAADVERHEAATGRGLPEFLAQAGSATSGARPKAGDHAYRPVVEDYRRDAEAFLKTYSGGNLPSCNLAHASLAEANRTFSKMLGTLMMQSDAQQEVDVHPWVADKPVQLGNPYAQARRKFGNEMFGGKPGLVKGVTEGWPAMSRWASTEDLISRVGDRHIPMMYWTYNTGTPIRADSLPENMRSKLHAPEPETLAEYLAHNDSGHNFFVFVNEPETESKELAGLVKDLSKDIQPLPSFSAHAEETHGILAIDGAGSSHAFHQHDGVWQTQVTGRKMWWLLPPSVPGVAGKERTPPIVDGQVYGNSNACELLLRRAAPEGAHVCVMEPGNTVILPDNWWHATCALDPITASIGGWLQDQKRDQRKGSEIISALEDGEDSEDAEENGDDRDDKR